MTGDFITRDAKYCRHDDYCSKWLSFAEKHFASTDKIERDLAGECSWIAANHAMRCILGARLPNTHGGKVAQMNNISKAGVLKGRFEKIGEIAHELHENAYESHLKNGDLKEKTKKVIAFSKAILDPNLSF